MKKMFTILTFRFSKLIASAPAKTTDSTNNKRKSTNASYRVPRNTICTSNDDDTENINTKATPSLAVTKHTRDLGGCNSSSTNEDDGFSEMLAESKSEDSSSLSNANANRKHIDSNLPLVSPTLKPESRKATETTNVTAPDSVVVSAAPTSSPLKEKKSNMLRESRLRYFSLNSYYNNSHNNNSKKNYSYSCHSNKRTTCGSVSDEYSSDEDSVSRHRLR